MVPAARYELSEGGTRRKGNWGTSPFELTRQAHVATQQRPSERQCRSGQVSRESSAHTSLDDSRRALEGGYDSPPRHLREEGWKRLRDHRRVPRRGSFKGQTVRRRE